ncbi:unnamed protein product [Musa hybrid cultivar]
MNCSRTHSGRRHDAFLDIVIGVEGGVENYIQMNRFISFVSTSGQKTRKTFVRSMSICIDTGCLSSSFLTFLSPKGGKVGDQTESASGREHSLKGDHFGFVLGEMERVSLHLLVILLALSHLLVSSQAIPATEKEAKDLATISEPRKVVEDDAATEDVVGGRMNVEISDYPISGANNRHTPPGRS